MGEMEDKLCDLRHKEIEGKLMAHEQKLEAHDQRLDAIDVKQATSDTRIDALCKEISGLVTTLKWFIGFLATTSLGLAAILVNK